MAIQQQVSVALIYGAEGTFGTPAAAGGTSKTLRRVGSTLSPNKAVFTSNEVRSDQQINDLRHGNQLHSGSLSGEISTASYDDFIAAVMRQASWTAGVTMAAADFTTSIASLNTGTNTGTWTGTGGAGNWLTKGFRIGDVVTPTGFTSTGANMNNVRFRVTAVTASTLTLAGPVLTRTETTGWTVAVTGSKLLVGTAKTAFSMEQQLPDITVSELYTGCRLGGMTLSGQPNGMATIGFDVMAQAVTNKTGGASPYFTSPTAQGTTGILSAVGGTLRMAGADQVIVTGVNLSVNNNLSYTPVIGTVLVPDIFYGRTVITGTVSALMSDSSMVDAFLNESSVDLTVLFTGLASPVDFISCNMQRIKLTGASHSIGPDNGVVATFPFQALIASGTGLDTSSLVIQRSN